MCHWIVLALVMILSLQQPAATGFYGNNDFSYDDYFLYPKRGPYSQLYRETKYPADQKIGMEHFWNAKAQINHGSEMFSLEMIGAIANALRDYDVNFIVSPISIWSLMLLLAEGADGDSFNQLRRTLHLPDENGFQYMRTQYPEFRQQLMRNTTTVELDVNHAIFSDSNRQVHPEYLRLTQRYYGVDYVPITSLSSIEAAKTINNYISGKTHGKIKNVVKPGDLNDVRLMLTSTIFFKGQWTIPFDTAKTSLQPFYGENGSPVADVPMMYQRNIFPYANITELGADVLELPYGQNDRLQMLILRPHSNTNLANVFENLKNVQISTIAYELHRFDGSQEYESTTVELRMPRFKIDSDFDLNTVLKHLGIKDIFDSNRDGLAKISHQSTFVSHIFHKAIIEVNEEGTVAVAYASTSLLDRGIIDPIKFKLNRPFGFLIVEQQTNAILFAGQIKHPNGN